MISAEEAYEIAIVNEDITKAIKYCEGMIKETATNGALYCKLNASLLSKDGYSAFDDNGILTIKDILIENGYKVKIDYDFLESASVETYLYIHWDKNL